MHFLNLALQKSRKNGLSLLRILQKMHKSDKILTKIAFCASKNVERLQRKNDRKMLQTPIIMLNYSRGTTLPSRKGRNSIN